MRVECIREPDVSAAQYEKYSRVSYFWQEIKYLVCLPSVKSTMATQKLE